MKPARLGERWLCALLVSTVVACSSTTSTPTEVVVAVNAAPELAPVLRALRVEIYDPSATDASSPANTRVFPLLEADSGQRVQTFPFSFAVTHAHADEFTLRVKGCTDGIACARVRVEQKLRVRFAPSQTVQVDVLLTLACDGAAERCAGLAQTCAPVTTSTVQAGTCVSVQTAASRAIRPGEELLPAIPATAHDSSSMDAGLDGADASEARDTALTPAVALCPSDNTCMQDLYPCEPDLGQGYVCRGQLADWPMPDFSTGSRVAPSYDTNSIPGVVRDLVTGLSWQRQTPTSYDGCTGKKAQPADTCTWQEAHTYCSRLKLAGLSWRLPTKVELDSLLDFRPEVRTLDPDIFFVTDYESLYWSSSPVFENPTRAWATWFGAGMSATPTTDMPQAVRCVRSAEEPLAAVPGRYVLRDGQVSGTRTGVSWDLRSVCEDQLSHAAAADFCAGLPEHLRLPTQKELLTLVDPTRGKPTVDPIFTGTPQSGFYWSSTPSKSPLDPTDAGTQYYGVEVVMGTGLTESFVRQLHKINPEIPQPFCVRCVR